MFFCRAREYSLMSHPIVSIVTATYNRFAYMPEMRQAVEKWEAHLATLL